MKSMFLRRDERIRGKNNELGFLVFLEVLSMDQSGEKNMKRKPREIPIMLSSSTFSLCLLSYNNLIYTFFKKNKLTFIFFIAHLI